MTDNSDRESTQQPTPTPNHHTPLPFTKQTKPFHNKKYRNSESWSKKQQLKYATFLIYFQHLLQDPVERQKFRIQQMMAQMIMTKNPKQCKNYFGKSTNKGITVTQLIQRIKARHMSKHFQKRIQRYWILAQTIKSNQQTYKYPQLPPTSMKQQKQIIKTDMSTPPSSNKSTSLNVESGFEPNVYLNLVESKNENVKTRAQTNETYDLQEDDQTYGIPVMSIDSSSQIQEQFDCSPVNNISSLQQRLTKYKNKALIGEDHKGTFKLTTYEMKYYERQKKKKEVERELHLINIQYLSTKLMKEKEEIKYFESAINLLNMSFSMAGTLI